MIAVWAGDALRFVKATPAWYAGWALANPMDDPPEPGTPMAEAYPRPSREIVAAALEALREGESEVEWCSQATGPGTVVLFRVSLPDGSPAVATCWEPDRPRSPRPGAAARRVQAGAVLR